MAQFRVNVPVVQRDPVISVDVTRASPLPIGANRFRLTVVDDAGNESEATTITVIVRDKDKPTAVLDLVDATGRVVDPTVAFGGAFTLSGARSTDIAPGKVVEYRFTLLDRT